MSLLFVTPIDVLTGVSTGLLFGTAVSAVIGVTSFVGTVFADRTLPPIAGGTATAMVTASLLSAAGVFDTSTIQPGLSLGVGLAVVLGLYTTRWGQQLAADSPRLITGSVDRTQPLAADAIDAVDAMGQVTIRSSGGVRESEGYPPLGPALRTALEDGAWRLPADLPRSELERRLEDRLREKYDLEAVAVAVDGRGRATITAAPPVNGIAKAVPEGWRAVSVRALLPMGLTPGDSVRTITDTGTVSGTVLSATVDTDVTDGGVHLSAAASEPRDCNRSTAGEATHSINGVSADSVTTGGPGRVTVAVSTTDAETLLDAEHARVAVTPRETTHEFEAVSLLERNETTIRRATLTEAVLDAVTAEDTDLEVFAVRDSEASNGDPVDKHAWQFEPEPAALTVGTEAFVLGTDTTVFGTRRDKREPAALEVGH
ncbi:hypothetical protein [Natronorubrum sp. A-ect3]|uniref:hypothetical protein n=1 Tax=Natronorubrum sp. A-ect3 TaxID=3242698 RepID=UPI00359D844F